MLQRRRIFALLSISLPIVFVCATLAIYGHRRADRFLSIPTSFAGDQLYVPDEELGFSHGRNVHSIRTHRESGVSYEIFTDRRGARVDDEHGSVPSKVGILTLGGSFSFGHGISNEKTYTSRLAAAFDVPAANLAVSSYGGVASLLRLKRHADLDPDLIIYGVIDGHYRRNVAPCSPNLLPVCISVPHVVSGPTGKLMLQPVGDDATTGIELTAEAVDLHTRESWIRRSFFGLRLVFHSLWSEVLTNKVPITTLQTSGAMSLVLHEMQRVAGRIDAALLVVYLPRMKLGVRERTLLSEVPDGAYFVDTTPALLEYMRRNDLENLHVAPGDRHPNAVAHRVIAEHLGAFIRGNSLL